MTKLNDNEFGAQTQIVRTNKVPLQIKYLIRAEGDKFKIFDIIAEGVSLISTQRTEFNAVLANGDINSLISSLDSKMN